MNKTLEGMARVYETRILAKRPFSPTEPMREALLYLADNVSDEMVYAYLFAKAVRGKNVDENVRKSIAAALRAAAGSAPTTLEVK